MPVGYDVTVNVVYNGILYAVFNDSKVSIHSPKLRYNVSSFQWHEAIHVDDPIMKHTICLKSDFTGAQHSNQSKQQNLDGLLLKPSNTVIYEQQHLIPVWIHASAAVTVQLSCAAKKAFISNRRRWCCQITTRYVTNPGVFATMVTPSGKWTVGDRNIGLPLRQRRHAAQLQPSNVVNSSADVPYRHCITTVKLVLSGSTELSSKNCEPTSPLCDMRCLNSVSLTPY